MPITIVITSSVITSPVITSSDYPDSSRLELPFKAFIGFRASCFGELAVCFCCHINREISCLARTFDNKAAALLKPLHYRSHRGSDARGDQKSCYSAITPVRSDASRTARPDRMISMTLSNWRHQYARCTYVICSIKRCFVLMFKKWFNWLREMRRSG